MIISIDQILETKLENDITALMMLVLCKATPQLATGAATLLLTGQPLQKNEAKQQLSAVTEPHSVLE